MRTRDEVQPVSDPYQFAAPFAWVLVKDGKPQGIPIAHRPSDWPEIERVWGATFTPLYPHRKSVEVLERQWLEACELAQAYCKRHGITDYGRSVFALLVEDADRMADRIRQLEQERDEDQGVIAVWRGRTERAEMRIQALEARGVPEVRFGNVGASEPVACRCGKCSGLGLVDVDLSDKPHPSAAGVTVTEAVDRIIYSLDEYARELDAHDYGLPVYGAPERMVRMRELIVTILTAASEGESDAAVAPCEWRLDDPDFHLYHTDCGNDFELNEDGPVENRMAFCCYCGKPMKAKRTRPTTPTRGRDE